MLPQPALLHAAPSARRPYGGASESDIVRTARPGLCPESDAFRAAVLLLAVNRTGVNVDRLTARTRFPRPWVAACVRRMVDSGAWVPGETVRGWPVEDVRFWNDVAVAQGLLLRRVDSHGRAEWAPPGTWHKAFDYVCDEAPGGATAYVDPAAGPEPEPEMEPEPTLEPARQPPSCAATAPPARTALRSEGPSPQVAAFARPDTGGGADLFPGAVWLS